MNLFCRHKTNLNFFYNIRDFDVRSVDVNKDNDNAKIFYLKDGFTIVSEELTDNSGRHYPILHLETQ